MAGLLAVHFSMAQSRPKIGLTLSGGGAKGLMHIGILQALDSAGLKIDYITGTSMGSIIGGMYAAGYSGDSIEKMTRPLDWNLLFSTSPQLKTISYEEKSEYQKYALEIPYEDGKFKIGRGIIEGQELWMKFSEVFRPVCNITDFSKLSIPFQCIGTDLATGNAVVMDHGNIVTAIRASMAIPSVFTPVLYDGKLLVDGGVVNNFPVLDVRKMGADYVIGVNLNPGLLKAEELVTALDILLQIGFFKDAASFELHKSKCDMFIHPDIKHYTAGSFDASDSLIDMGIETGRQYYPIFKRMADSLNALYGTVKFTKNRLPADQGTQISKFTVDGLEHTESNFFFGLLGLKAGRDYTNKEMNDAIRRVYGSRYYRSIRYDYELTAGGGTEMHFHVEEFPLTDVKVALNYNDFTKLSLHLNMTTRDFFLKESRALASVAISENPRLYGEYYKYINKKRNARVVLDYYFESIDYPLYNDFRLYETLRSAAHIADLRFERNLSLFSAIGVGQQYIYSKIRTEEIPSFIYNGTNHHWYSYLFYAMNNANKKYFPVKGWTVRTEAGFVFNQDMQFEYAISDTSVTSDSLAFSSDDYLKLKIHVVHYSEISSRLSWSQNLQLGWLMEEDPYIGDQFLAGGVNDIIRNQVPFAGLNESEVKTGSIATAQLGLQYQLAKSAFLTGRVNAAIYDFEGLDSGKLNSDNLLTGYSLSVGYDSALGPIDFSVMYCDQDKKVRTHVSVGFDF